MQAQRMQQIALTSVFPRSIAWLIRPNEHEQLERVVKFNCAMLGGYFNTIIPLTEALEIPQPYLDFLLQVDPDFIVLAPGMTALKGYATANQPYPFALLPWEAAPQVVHPYPDESAPHAGPTQQSSILSGGHLPWHDSLVATADSEHPQLEVLALVACGEVEPTRWRYLLVDGEDNARKFHASGYREQFLSCVLPEGAERAELSARIVPIGSQAQQQIEAPSRLQLSSLIRPESNFARLHAIARMRACYESQRFPIVRPTFVNLTASDKRREGYSKPNWQANLLPRMVLLIGSKFGLQEAALFWNLRACEVYVSFLYFREVEENLDSVAAWLESERSFIYYSLGTRTGVHFSTSDSEYTRLQELVEKLRRRKSKEYPHWHLARRYDLIRYDYDREPFQRKHVVVSPNETAAAFAATVPVDRADGYLSVLLEWNGLLVPPKKPLVQALVSSELLGGAGHYTVSLEGGSRWEVRSEPISRFRVNRQRRFVVQVDRDALVQFGKPSLPEIFAFLVGYAGFDRVAPSSTARYHVSFVRLAGGLQRASELLSRSPNRELFETLADNSDQSKLGWVLQNPSRRRGLHHLHLRQMLGTTTPAETRVYFDTVSDDIPESGLELLEKRLLERVFLLPCDYCSYKAWYPVDQAGQTFQCGRCFQSQVYHTNPLWLYKLPEVVFQGFADNMQVPLLALNCMRKRTVHNFEWMPDSNVYDSTNLESPIRNIDLICLVDGKLYVGEAKSNNSISADQFSWYERFLRRTAVDGLVFATSQTRWSQGTADRINRLRAQFSGEVVGLTSADLYAG